MYSHRSDIQGWRGGIHRGQQVSFPLCGLSNADRDEVVITTRQLHNPGYVYKANEVLAVCASIRVLLLSSVVGQSKAVSGVLAALQQPPRDRRAVLDWEAIGFVEGSHIPLTRTCAWMNAMVSPHSAWLRQTTVC